MNNKYSISNINYFLLSFVSLIIVTGFISCGKKSGETNDNPAGDTLSAAKYDTGAELGAKQQGSILAELTAEQAKSIGVETGTIEQKQLTASLKANGILNVPNQNKANATTLYGGVIKTLNVQAGGIIKKGDLIATISNTQYIQLQEDYLTVKSKIILAEQENNRQKDLSKNNAGLAATLQASEADLKILKTREASLDRQITLMGINPETLSNSNLQSSLSIKSPMSGVVSHVNVKIGSYVDVSTPVAEIIDNSQIHLDLFVYEKDLSKLKVGQVIHFTLTNNAGKEYDAEIYGISNSFEDNSKAIAVHCNVKGDKTGLIDGMSITALVSLSDATVTAVPSSAIVNFQGQDYIFIVFKTDIKTGIITYERIAVAKGTNDVGYSEITLLKEIPAGSKIVTKGAFFILAKQTNMEEDEG
ncbi:MAG: efflux RND transporter periplasmic adaptor subunit [Bacteroidia bacterium]|nr:efflux RND transporter periplasmic adaptor subunit [Bacteroidia bacterium]